MLIDEFTADKFIKYTTPFGPKERQILYDALVEDLEGIDQLLERLNGLCNLEDYRRLEGLNLFTHGHVARLLNENGHCGSTVCPVCFIDDFTHTANCSGTGIE